VKRHKHWWWSITIRTRGLGLYLSRECARRMGGDLVLDESAPDTGSRFLRSLPSAQDRAHDPAPVYI
jgi:signal transduction histidine kinase